MPLAKILWLKENQPEIYEKAAAFLISSKDYVVARLTGNFIGDMTACATAGAMDLEHKTWSEHLINDAGLDINKFPKLLHSHELAGVITERELLIPAICPEQSLRRHRRCRGYHSCQWYLSPWRIQCKPGYFQLGGSCIKRPYGQ